MVALGIVTERIVLRPLVNQPQITLFMATIGLAFFLEGAAQMIWGTDVRPLDLGIKDEPIEALMTRFDMVISNSTSSPQAVAGFAGCHLAIFFNKTRIGRALRAVADDHQAALAVGIPLRRSGDRPGRWAGFVALVAGLMWGAAQRRAVRIDLRRVEGPTRADPGRIRIRSGRHRRRPDHRRVRELAGST
jgi:branched-chain amino acid transport system permease protein